MTARITVFMEKTKNKHQKNPNIFLDFVRRQSSKVGIPKGQSRASRFCNSGNLAAGICNTEFHYRSPGHSFGDHGTPSSSRGAAQLGQHSGRWGLVRCCCGSHNLLHPFPLLWWFPQPCRDEGNCCQVFPAHPAHLPPILNVQVRRSGSASVNPMF